MWYIALAFICLIAGAGGMLFLLWYLANQRTDNRGVPGIGPDDKEPVTETASATLNPGTDNERTIRSE